MGLYGERIGAVNFVCASSDEAAAVMSQVAPQHRT
jgi:aspartate/tyrosine/aromatic aminotransferase